MQAYTRFRVVNQEGFLEQARILLTLWSEQPGLIRAGLQRSTDEPDLYLLASEWQSASAYRRALSPMDVRMVLMPMSLTALNEPGTYETVMALDDEGAVLTDQPDATPGPGHARDVSARRETTRVSPPGG